MRTFEEIIADATTNRNILEIHLKKNIPEEEPKTKPSNITHDQLGELLFDCLMIKREDCLRFNFTSARYDTREVMLKPGVDLNPFVKTISDFYGHTITTRKQSSNVLRVSFRNVPLNVPDEEIINLCTYYGKPVDNIVHYDRMSNTRNNGNFGATRFVEMEMQPGKSFQNFYWMEGPLPGDQGCRITVLHSGQERQCSHCLKTCTEGCPGQGQGKACKELGTRMMRMVDYMLSIKEKTGYESLKAEYARRFPTLGKGSLQPNSMMEEENKDDDENNEEIFSVTPGNPVVRKNAEIASLEKTLKEKEEQAEEERKAAEQKHFQAKRFVDLAKNKISTATNCLDMYLMENLKDSNFDEFSPSFMFLVTQYAALLFTPDCYSINIETNTVTMDKDLFQHLPGLDANSTENLNLFKIRLKEKLELDLTVRKERRNSTTMLPRPRTNSIKRSSDTSISNSNKAKQVKVPLSSS